MSELINKAQELLSMDPLPDDVEARFEALYLQANKVEKIMFRDLDSVLEREMIEQGIAFAEAEPDAAAQQAAIDKAVSQAATSEANDLPAPTQAQKEAGNYRKAKINLYGLDIVIENPKNSTRSGKSADGTEWSSSLTHHYGDISGTVGADGDKLDVFIGDDLTADKVFVVHQVDPGTGDFDEHKIMMAFDSEDAAERAYLSNYEDGWQGLGKIEAMDIDAFKAWLEGFKK